ncbi:hypothetical protein [Solitalea canadensis]|uniref:Uncharacterized protein n=1 Tax=Solitalea canadensis (strain ATCC 29591 / DSM 3403 / JCM 21819 / LMG 8368 / NBRC 15130 / NCIMB 12057 / USAM 9D) TaxID=929556 RepID=H8KPS9_SOLCM|nr:hypothetical protein [Solitalea canadensis]AFD05977.1 hypothetical protein Solca_0862 [Solitalea canadensis DSM 3403]
MEQFDLNEQYKLYLQRVGLKEVHMSPIQRIETKRAFFGACGQMLLLMRDDIGAIEDDNKAIEAMDNLLNQVGNFWLNESGKHN